MEFSRGIERERGKGFERDQLSDLQKKEEAKQIEVTHNALFSHSPHFLTFTISDLLFPSISLFVCEIFHRFGHKFAILQPTCCFDVGEGGGEATVVVAGLRERAGG